MPRTCIITARRRSFLLVHLCSGCRYGVPQMMINSRCDSWPFYPSLAQPLNPPTERWGQAYLLALFIWVLHNLETLRRTPIDPSVSVLALRTPQTTFIVAHKLHLRWLHHMVSSPKLEIFSLVAPLCPLETHMAAKHKKHHLVVVWLADFNPVAVDQTHTGCSQQESSICLALKFG